MFKLDREFRHFLTNFDEITKNYFFLWRVHRHELEQNMVHFGSRHPEYRKLRHDHTKLPVTRQVVFNLVVALIFGTRSFAYILFDPVWTKVLPTNGNVRSREVDEGWPQHWALKAGVIFPPSCRLNFHMTLFLWSLNGLMIFVKSFRIEMAKLSFMAIFSLAENGTNKRKGLVGRSESGNMLRAKDLSKF